MPDNQSQILLYKTEDGKTQIQVALQEETVWLTQAQIADLFQKDVRTVNEHIQNIYQEGELEKTPTIRKFRIVQSEGKPQVTRDVDFYNLDVIISVGYRVKSHRGTQFRIWATKRLREYVVKGFVMDDERREKRATNYFDELIREDHNLERCQNCQELSRRARAQTLLQRLVSDFPSTLEMSFRRNLVSAVDLVLRS